MRFLLDTCAVLWLAGDGASLDESTIAELELSHNELFVSAIPVNAKQYRNGMIKGRHR